MYRKSLGLSQKQMSENLQLTQSTVSKIENGKIFGKSFIKYLKYLVSQNLDINDFFRDR